jgi:ATP-dependent Clp protease ATP-binding subunit ClpC
MRLEVEKVVHTLPFRFLRNELPLNPQAQKVIEHATEEADKHKLPDIGTGFLLLGILREKEAVAAQILLSLGFNLEEIRETVIQLINKGAS